MDEKDRNDEIANLLHEAQELWEEGREYEARQAEEKAQELGAPPADEPTDQQIERLKGER